MSYIKKLTTDQSDFMGTATMPRGSIAMSNSDTELERAMSHARSTSNPKELERLSRSKYVGVVESVLSNAHTPRPVIDYVMERVSTIPDKQIKRQLLRRIFKNPNTSEETLALAADGLIELRRSEVKQEAHHTFSLGSLFSLRRGISVQETAQA